MFIVYGRRIARIKSTLDHIGTCTSCNAVGLDVKVYKPYGHLFWIPFFPIGSKEVVVQCKSCGAANNFNPRVKHFESITTTPVWFYSGLILVAGLIVWLTFARQEAQENNLLFIADPKAGDVYTMYQEVNDTTQYIFLRVARVDGDSVFVYPNQYRYFSLPSRFEADDSFLEVEYGYTKKELKDLLDKEDIRGVDREYGDETGFNRISPFGAELFEAGSAADTVSN